MNIRLLHLTILLCAMFGTTAQYPGDTLEVRYRLHGQSRRFKTVMTPLDDGSMRADWSIVRNLNLWTGSFTTTSRALESADGLAYVMPEDKLDVTLPDNRSHLLLSRNALNSLKTNGKMSLDGLDWKLTGDSAGVLTATNNRHSATLTVLNDPQFPLVTSMHSNPLEIDWTISFPTRSLTPREEITLTPEKSGGIYYAYPVNEDDMPAIPNGYKVTHLSHYGRHGSRWLIKTWEYDTLCNILASAQQRGMLTPLGNDVLERAARIREHASGHKGELSSLGVNQHRGISGRMARRFPSLFADSARITAYSSTEPRCIVSMAAFSERLKEINPCLKIDRHASPGDMDFISYSNTESKAINDPSSPWWHDLAKWRDNQLNPSRLINLLFTDTTAVHNPNMFMWVLHDVAVGCQDADPGTGLLDLFTADELYTLWSALNYKMYYTTGNNPATHAAGPRSAANLLSHIIADIDSALTQSRPGRSATLRFGHDTALLRLLALMQIDGASASVNNPDDYAEAWQDYRLSPMAANLQLLLLTADCDREPLILIRLNETPGRMPLESINGGYYRWNDVRNLWNDNISNAYLKKDTTAK